MISVALIGAMTTGCYTTTLIPAPEVVRLSVNGAPPGAPRVVRDVEGELVTIGEKFTLTIEPRSGLPPAWEQWRATTPPIKSPFAAELRGPMLILQGQADPMVTQVPLAYVQQIRVRELSAGKTAGFVIGVSLGGLAALVGTAFLIALTGSRPVSSGGSLE